MYKPASVIAICMLVFAAPTLAERDGNAWRALLREQPDLGVQIAPAWGDALSRMSVKQLDALRRGADLDTIVLDGGQTLAAFMATGRLVEVPLEVLVEPIGGGVSRGESFLVEATVRSSAKAAAGESLTGGTLRLDPLLPGGGGTSTNSQFQLTASVGQPTVAPSNSSQTTLRPGFWTQAGVAPVDGVFSDGFE